MREKTGWNRREFLKGAGVAIGLPFFPSLFPRTAWAEGVKPPVRLMHMCVPLGFIPDKVIATLGDGPKTVREDGPEGWFPEMDGDKYKMPYVHASLEPYREHISFLKGVSNRKYRGDAHMADNAFLTCADTLADPSKSFSNTISCDQVAASSAAMGGQDVRYRNLPLGIQPYWMGSSSGGLSWTPSGVPISPLTSPAHVFDMLFGKEDVPAATRLLRLQQRRSVLDMTLEQINRLKKKLDAADRNKLDEVVTAVHDVEANIQREKMWMNVEKPKVSFERPDEATTSNSASVSHARTMFELAHAAFLTDSTRVITYEMPAAFKEFSTTDKHGLSHNGSPEGTKEAINLDRAMSEQVAYFIKMMTESKEHDGQPLIHHTAAAYGAAVWGRYHCVRSVPLMLIGHGGGKIKQGFTRTYPSTTPLANVWLTMLQACGVTKTQSKEAGDVKKTDDAAIDAFADSTGTLEGLT